jgi:hypothetical protein
LPGDRVIVPRTDYTDSTQPLCFCIATVESNEEIAMADSEIPFSARAASWLGKFAPSCALAGLLGIHIGAVPPIGGYLIFMIGLLCSPLALGFGAKAYFATRDDKDGPGRRGAWFGLASGMLMLSAAIVGAGPGRDKPPINDITTNLEDPPQFASPQQVPDYAGRDMSYPPEFVEIVRAGYPYLESIELSDTAPVAYDKAIATAEYLGWEVVFRDEENLRFDAREESSVFKFVDDVTVRVRASQAGATIDVRSKSRVGRGDIGANAARIMAFTRAVKE